MISKPKFKPAYFGKSPTLGLSPSADDIQKLASDRILESFSIELRRIFSLFKHYGIPQESESSGLMLAMLIARDFIPNFAVRVRKKARRTNKEFSAFNLFLEVEATMHACSVKASTACNLMAEHEATPAPFRREADSIKSSYYQMKKKITGDKELQLIVLFFRKELERHKRWHAFDVKAFFLEGARPLFRKVRK